MAMLNNQMVYKIVRFVWLENVITNFKPLIGVTGPQKGVHLGELSAS
jgi:hypothetical protein